MRWVACGRNSSYSSLTLPVFRSWFEDVLMFWGYSPVIFINLFHFFDLVFSRSDTLWAQLLLEFSTDHFETVHICSTWSADVHVVLGLSS